MVEAEPVHRPPDAREVARLHVWLYRRPHEMGIRAEVLWVGKGLVPIGVAALSRALVTWPRGQTGLVVVNGAEQTVRHPCAYGINRRTMREIHMMDATMQRVDACGRTFTCAEPETE